MGCSNLFRACEKQYLQDQADAFKKLADFFKSKAEPVKEANVQKLLDLIETDLTVGYPYGNSVSSEKPDRGALRCLSFFRNINGAKGLSTSAEERRSCGRSTSRLNSE